ncbi:hypothetical protein THS27_11135 [Thalassospira sp. MCCC 1A01428]|nr:hypothetical protein THS27_11135 [Thalassospira sp. MCCC 1A01428]
MMGHSARRRRGKILTHDQSLRIAHSNIQANSNGAVKHVAIPRTSKTGRNAHGIRPVHFN